MSKTTLMFVAAGVLGSVAASAMGQTPLPLLSPSFETPNPLNPASPDQFTNQRQRRVRVTVQRKAQEQRLFWRSAMLSEVPDYPFPSRPVRPPFRLRPYDHSRPTAPLRLKSC